jgi:hypothetical protein
LAVFTKGRRKGQLWQTIASNYPNLRAAFNGGLYGRVNQKAHFIESCNIDDQWLETFIDEIAGEDSSYLFDQIPIEILGSVYERFLGSTVDANGRVSLKPEIRRQGGVFYWPILVVSKLGWLFWNPSMRLMLMRFLKKTIKIIASSMRLNFPPRF